MILLVMCNSFSGCCIDKRFKRECDLFFCFCSQSWLFSVLLMQAYIVTNIIAKASTDGMQVDKRFVNGSSILSGVLLNRDQQQSQQYRPRRVALKQRRRLHEGLEPF